MNVPHINVASLGGGHGLHQTLLAAKKIAAAKEGAPDPADYHVNAIVTVADDGGSSGRLRRELDIVPPGDLRMALAALTPPSEFGAEWADIIQHLSLIHI